ncbi:MAG: UvrD-helicase domain-containing protein [Nitrospirota bacterium]
MRLLNGLSNAQREAVTTVEAPLLIVAGSGTGKTRTITHRIAYLIEQGVSPENILAVTFTNRAANEMRERAEAILRRQTGSLFIGTFHSLGLKIIKENRGKDFILYDRNEQINLLKKLSDSSSAPKLAEKITRIKNFIDEPDNETRKLYEDYQKLLKENSALDFDDLILEAVEILSDSMVLEKYQTPFKYIMVDEYQDINPAQYRFIRLLAGDKRNICAVGDPDQAIYAFRGADVENFLNFERDFPDAKIIKLTHNYRSTGVILNASNNLIKNNIKRIEKELKPIKDKGRHIVIYSVPEEEMEGEVIVKEIEERLGGTSYYQLYVRGALSPLRNPPGEKIFSQRYFRFSDFAVFFRINAQAKAIEESFIKSGIPYQVVGERPFLERQEIRDILSYFKVIINPEDSMSLERIINRPPRGIGEATVTMLANHAKRNGLPLFYNITKTGHKLSNDKRKKIKEFVSMIEHFMELKGKLTVDELLKLVLRDTGLQEYYRDREESLLFLENLSLAYRDIQAPESFIRFINDIALLTPSDVYDPRADRVALMTLHTAKGLEFRTVFIAGVEDGLIPYTFKDDVDIEEERRLFYVGMTRAKEELFLLCARNRFLYGRSLNLPTSSFLKEIPEEFVESRFIPDKIKKVESEPQMGLF